ncbi:LysR substrate-binding domain-containing protein [Caballeronia sp. LP006]|jgi:DNA-binding transcriptional LysR family regulator|uniref:LysR substrate-binding domain-containing protein n=1 Tax=unclassified Caballeronia TaxID=2646786 RepID=UPI002027927B|nr:MULTISPECIES: LysR substrate-binding domain-containing protein [unclassified Caballeronia]MDR5801847.1 LysR substrate-binding domain-containing protein [Caballeronia sp. LZ001]MDR5828682.1 LysR substrate-binding domain-containing protein [Caballeronia sp. LP006]
MRRIPNFVLLRAFEAAARLESFTLAASELHLTQSAISHQVKELEQYFGRPLFHRRNRRVETTSEGRRLHESLGRVFDVIEAACGEVALEPQAQVLAVHCAPSFAAKWLAPRLPEFMSEHPMVTIRLSSDAEPADLARVREVDVAISYGFAHERPGVITRALGAERIVPLCSPALVRDDVPVAEQIRKLTLIDSQLSRVTWPGWFALNELEMPRGPRPSFDRAALAISAAADGMGVALETTRLAERELARGDLIELGAGIFAPLARETHFLSYRVTERNVEKVKCFRDWVLMKAGLDETVEA